jgi:hypothetical protein
VYWTDLSQDRNKWRTLVSTALTFWFYKIQGISKRILSVELVFSTSLLFN